MRILLCGLLSALFLTPDHCAAADFDGDGVSDHFALVRDAAKVSKDSAIRFVNPWADVRASKQAPKGFGLLIRLSRVKRAYLLNDPGFFDSPVWTEAKPPVQIITRKDPRYRAWKKQVSALRNDAIQLGTEAGIDILLYWDGKEWSLFWPNEEP